MATEAIHILRAPPTTTADEERQLALLTKGQRRYLKNKACALCEYGIGKKGCGNFYEACPESARIARRSDCLAKYSPRKGRTRHA